MTQIRPTTYDAILEAAFSLFNTTPTASLADVAIHAGVGRATLHRHFSGRDALIKALSERAAQELGTAINAAVKDAPSYSAALRLTLEAIIPLGDRQWFLSHEPTQIPAAKQAKDRTELIAAIDAAKSEGTFDPHVPSTWIAESYDNLIYAAWTLVRTSEATPKQASEFAWRTLTSGLQGDAS